jgi:acetylglutamate kinase
MQEPSLRKEEDKAVVIKFGGELAANKPALRGIAEAVIDQWTQGKPIVVGHGGGVQINKKLESAGLPIGEMKKGVRATPPESIGTIRQGMDELTGQICDVLNEVAHERGLPSIAIGMGGYTNNLVSACTKPGFEGFATGDVAAVDAEQLRALTKKGIPVIHCICAKEGDPTQSLNVNADDVAAGMATAIGARRLVYCTNTCVLDKSKQRISMIESDKVDLLVDDKTIEGGMANKVRACAAVVNSGKVGGVVIIDGNNPENLAKELNSDEGAGTLVTRNPITQPPPRLAAPRI